MSGLTRQALDRQVLDWIEEGALAPADDARFDALARELFAFQFEHNAPYARLCRARGVVPEQLEHWTGIPTVPTGAFKEARLACFDEADCMREFRTSGSTTDRRGVLHLDTLRLYDASLAATFGAFVCSDVERIRFVVLAPSSTALTDSSLSYMFARAIDTWGTPESGFRADAEGWKPEDVIDELASLTEPVAVVGTAFAFVHLIDALAGSGRRLALARGSRIVETGGFKGRSRVVERSELHAAIAESFGLGLDRIVNQYGMCELGSQFYEATLRDGRPTGVKCVPPWVRTRVLDPETLAEQPPGEPGLLAHYDLANTGSVLAVLTSDLGRASGEGFELFGRLPGAEERGCSIAADVLLARA